MRLKDIKGSANREVSVTMRLWAQAALLGRARRLSNEGRRADHRDRGFSRNELGDLRGAFCELYLCKEVYRHEKSQDAITYMQRHLFNPSGGSAEQGADLVFVDHESVATIGIDVKSFDCAPNKQYFAINASKHEALRSRASFYFCLIAPPLSSTVAISKLVPYADVDQWEKRTLGSYRDPARVLPIGAFMSTYFDTPPRFDELTEHLFEEDEVQSEMRSADLRRRLTEFLPDLIGYV